MSSPQNDPKSNNSNPINKIKTFPKAVFSYGQSCTIKLEIKKAPATAGAFSVPHTRNASKSFADRNLAISPMVAIF
jgi:hypothetical protein